MATWCERYDKKYLECLQKLINRQPNLPHGPETKNKEKELKTKPMWL